MDHIENFILKTHLAWGTWMQVWQKQSFDLQHQILLQHSAIQERIWLGIYVTVIILT